MFRPVGSSIRISGGGHRTRPQPALEWVQQHNSTFFWRGESRKPHSLVVKIGNFSPLAIIEACAIDSGQLKLSSTLSAFCGIVQTQTLFFGRFSGLLYVRRTDLGLQISYRTLRLHPDSKVRRMPSEAMPLYFRRSCNLATPFVRKKKKDHYTTSRQFERSTEVPTAMCHVLLFFVPSHAMVRKGTVLGGRIMPWHI